ncbi:MAG TPA: DUF1844 domain-containing protein [Chthoniobacterales bacterium]|jgi:uncharacterized protein DUF1844|nr:DUF1844 domain-containing protein [Chthoniobacterales bacterium]
MAEFQNTSAASGEMAQRFIEFVLMQAQNAAFVLGQIPHPQTGKAEVNLDLARLLIDQLAMIQEKTKGNLNKDEAQILANTLSNLQIAFVEAVREQRSERKAETAAQQPAEPQPESKIETPAAETPTASESEGKKKFVKSYGS